MQFHSILFEQPKSDAELNAVNALDFFPDLNLDQVFQSLTAGREEYNLKPLLSTPLDNVEAVIYRQEVLRDIEGEALHEQIETFARNMRTMRKHLAQADKLNNEYQKARWFLDAVEIYCLAITGLADELTKLDLKSRGLRDFSEYLKTYANSKDFQSLIAETKKLKEDLQSITYSIQIRGRRVTVKKYEAEPDYSTDVEETFRKFQQGVVKDYQFTFDEHLKMNHVEEDILNRVALLYPDIFLALRNYYASHRDSFNPTISRFDREAQFYTAYLELVEKIRSNGLKFCYPSVSKQSKEIYAHETFDLALAIKLVQQQSAIVCNDFYLKNRERIFVVSGPNQGGKTTFARTFGQLHYLASLGYLVPASEAQLFLCDRIFTHFEKEERIEDLRGKLQDELIRIHNILQRATSNSIIIMNESFASTTISDALFLGQEILHQIIQRDILCVYVTFVDELSTLGDATVSMVSTITPENPALRTYRIERRPADGRAYAIMIAEKYGLTYESLKRRIAR